MKRIISLTAIVLCLGSCSLTRKIPMEAEYNVEWQGKRYSEIVMHFGAPDRVEYDGMNGQILVYENFTTVTTTDVDTHFGRFDPDYTTKVRTDKDYIHFFLDENDICYLVKSNEKRTDPKAEKRSKVLFWTHTGILGALTLLIPIIMAG